MWTIFPAGARAMFDMVYYGLDLVFRLNVDGCLDWVLNLIYKVNNKLDKNLSLDSRFGANFILTILLYSIPN